MTQDNQKVLKSRFDDKLCCAHNWVKKHDIEVCTTCNATCKRDTDGLILIYDIKGIKL